MRATTEITHNGVELDEILALHKKWLNGEPDGQCAYLTDADLRDAKGVLVIGPGGSRGAMLYAVLHSNCVMIKAGCYWGTLGQFREAVQTEHGENEHAKYYQAAIAFIETWAKLQGKE